MANDNYLWNSFKATGDPMYYLMLKAKNAESGDKTATASNLQESNALR